MKNMTENEKLKCIQLSILYGYSNTWFELANLQINVNETPTTKDETMQRGRQGEESVGRRSQDLHEHLSQGITRA